MGGFYDCPPQVERLHVAGSGWYFFAGVGDVVLGRLGVRVAVWAVVAERGGELGFWVLFLLGAVGDERGDALSVDEAALAKVCGRSPVSFHTAR